MTTTVKLIIRVMDGRAISIIIDNNEIPNTFLSNLAPDINFTIECIAERFNIHQAYIRPKLVHFGTSNGEPEVYYTIMTPKEFLDEKAISKLCSNFEKLNQQDCVAIRQAISLPPY